MNSPAIWSRDSQRLTYLGGPVPHRRDKWVVSEISVVSDLEELDGGKEGRR